MMPDDFLKSREWLNLRYRVLRKQGGFCRLCGHRGSHNNPIQVDHIKSRWTFPHLALVESNLQVLCRDCNLGKGAYDATDWRPPRVKASLELIASVQRMLAKDAKP